MLENLEVVYVPKECIDTFTFDVKQPYEYDHDNSKIKEDPSVCTDSMYLSLKDLDRLKLCSFSDEQTPMAVERLISGRDITWLMLYDDTDKWFMVSLHWYGNNDWTNQGLKIEKGCGWYYDDSDDNDKGYGVEYDTLDIELSSEIYVENLIESNNKNN